MVDKKDKKMFDDSMHLSNERLTDYFEDARALMDENKYDDEFMIVAINSMAFKIMCECYRYIDDESIDSMLGMAKKLTGEEIRPQNTTVQ